MKNSEIINFIKNLYKDKDFIALHEPVFFGNEKRYINECIDSTFVSSVGKFVDQFEEMVADFVGSKYAIATVNGTSALHISLKLVGVDENSEVITQPLTFIATCNAIDYCNAKPIFVDVDKETLGMSPKSLKNFLEKNTFIKDNICYNKLTNKKIAAVLPMHTFGHPCKIDKIKEICDKWNIPLVEDAAESLGSYYKSKHTGTFGKVSSFSFNGNKTITTGGGGMIVTDDEELAKKAKHLTTTAKTPHPYEYIHDKIGYNYRLPNLNAALGCAQMENLKVVLDKKREISKKYEEFFKNFKDIKFVKEPKNTLSNYWLNAIIFENKNKRDKFLKDSNNNSIMTRPIWRLMNKLEMFQDAQCTNLDNALWLEDRVVNLPSGLILP